MTQFLIYKTIQGDTFDSISLDFYDDEYLASEIIKLNPDHISTLVFDKDVELKIPVIETTLNESLPPWKR